MQPQKHEPRRYGFFRGFFRLLIFVIVFAEIVFFISIAFARAMHRKELGEKIRRFNHRRLNPLTLRIAGNRLQIYARVKHVGRHTGKEYATPVIARPLDDGFVIPLPYGSDVDWCQNVMAAGTCTLLWNGQEYALEKPEYIHPLSALVAYPFIQRLVFKGGGIEKYLMLHQKQEVPAKVLTSV